MTATRTSPRDCPAPDHAAALAAALEHCRQVTRHRARNFYYGLKLTPQPKRAAMYALYAVMRACDDLADEITTDPELPPPARADALAEGMRSFRRQMQGVITGQGDPDLGLSTDGPVWRALGWLMRQYPLDPRWLDEMLDGQADDLAGRTYADAEELAGYCYRVAGTVGLACISIWGYEGGQATRQLAIRRGQALQLTNILRDVAEDAERGRVYLPVDHLRRAGYASPTAFLEALQAARGRLFTFSPAGGPGGEGPVPRPAPSWGEADYRRFEALLTPLIDLAQRCYDESAALETYIAPDCRATSWALMRIYRGLLDKIAARPRRVLDRRVRLSAPAKSLIALRAVWRHKLGVA